MELKQATILLVDDEPFLREIMCAWLERAGRRVFCAEDGRKALKVLAANKIDLIISDVRMPVIDGIELLKRINESPHHRPGMIFVTGFSDLTLREAYDMGVEAILEKPIKREEMLRAARNSVATADELWQRPPTATPDARLKISFPSFPAALEEKRLGFGRRGFCIKPRQPVREGRIEFALEFKAESLVLRGHGVVRWMAPEESIAGIEITRLDPPSRNWLVAYLKRTKPLPVIPSHPGRDRWVQSKVA
jgi:CheY-like chemotaxis protein